jgi:hypothetical protein
VDSGEDAAWLSVDAAALRLGLSRDAVRKRIKRGSLEARRGNDASVRVLVTSATPAAPVQAAAADASGTAVGQSADTALLVENARLVERLAAEARRSAELHGALAAERARGDRLEAALVEVRKGWLERLLEAVRRR